LAGGVFGFTTGPKKDPFGCAKVGSGWLSKSRIAESWLDPFPALLPDPIRESSIHPPSVPETAAAVIRNLVPLRFVLGAMISSR
jgi:hypothetical protein